MAQLCDPRDDNMAGKSKVQLPPWFSDKWQWIKQSGKSLAQLVVPAGLALWANTLLESQLSHTAAQAQRKFEQNRRISEMHPSYSQCMRSIIEFKQEAETAGNSDYGKVFAEKVKINDSRAAEVNRCRSLCKDYWREVIELRDTFSIENPERLKELTSRHRRFVDIVKPLDQLPGYEDEPQYVYAEFCPAKNSTKPAQ